MADTRPCLKGKASNLQGDMTVPHFDGKADANGFFKDLKVPTTFLNTTFFMSNFINFGMAPKKDKDGKYSITTNMKDVKMPIIDVEDLA